MTSVIKNGIIREDAHMKNQKPLELASEYDAALTELRLRFVENFGFEPVKADDMEFRKLNRDQKTATKAFWEHPKVQKLDTLRQIYYETYCDAGRYQ